MKPIFRWIGNLLLLAGVIVLIWQFVGTRHTANVRDQQLDAFSSLKAEAVVNEGTEQPNSTNTLQASSVKEKGIGDVVGVLSIPQLDIDAPVSYGATPEILDMGFGVIPSLYDPGVKDGSYAIAGHQSHVFGQFFNRLDELESGSRFDFETLDETQTYEVYDVQIVNPEDVEAISKEPGIAKLSLVTCYPQNSTKYRLVVNAKRVDK